MVAMSVLREIPVGGTLRVEWNLGLDSSVANEAPALGDDGVRVLRLWELVERYP